MAALEGAIHTTSREWASGFQPDLPKGHFRLFFLADPPEDGTFPSRVVLCGLDRLTAPLSCVAEFRTLGA